MSKLEEILHFGEVQILQTYNNLARKYSGDKKIILLLGIAYKKAINGDLKMLLEFEDDLEANKKFFGSRLIMSGVKDGISQIIFSDGVEILEDLGKTTTRKKQLVSILFQNLGFTNYVGYGTSLFSFSLMNNLIDYLDTSFFDFVKKFPNIHDKLTDIGNREIDYDEGLEFVLSLLFSIGDKRTAYERLMIIEKSMGPERKFDLKSRMLEIENKYDSKRLRVLLVSIGIYGDFSSIKGNNFNLTLEQRKKLKTELEKRFGVSRKGTYVYDKFQDFENLSLKEIIGLLERMVFLEIVQKVKFMSQEDGFYLESNIDRIDDGDFQSEVLQIIWNISGPSLKFLAVSDNYFWIDVLHIVSGIIEKGNYGYVKVPNSDTLDDLIKLLKK